MTTTTTSIITDAELALVEGVLRRTVTGDVNLLSTAGQRIISAGGKRIRPRLVLLSYRAAGGEDVLPVVPVAAAVELLHTASLVHDDINDRSHLRRGQPSVNAQFGDGLALLVGDYVFLRALDLMADLGSRVIHMLAGACREIVEGETLEILNLGNASMSEDTYLRIVALKTASLFAACASLGATVAGGTQRDVRALGEYGLNVGMAFQITDDTLDLNGDAAALGKPVGNDLAQRKMSLAAMYAPDDTDRARDILLRGDAAQCARLLHDAGALRYAGAKAAEYSQKAADALDGLRPSPARAELYELAHCVPARTQ